MVWSRWKDPRREYIYIFTRIFEKVAPEDVSVFTRTTPKPRFYDSEQPRNHMREKEKGGKRGEKKKGLRHLDRADRFQKSR